MHHHFVPQFLLKEWISAADKKLVEFRIDLPQIVAQRRPKKSVGFVDDLLCLDRESIAGSNKQFVETDLMGRVDNDAAPVHKKMLGDGIRNLHDAECSDWVRLLISLRARQPNFVARAKSSSTQALLTQLNQEPETYLALAGAEHPPTARAFVEKYSPGLIENFGLTLYTDLIDNHVVGQKLMNLRWFVCDVSSYRHELLLSDNPYLISGNLDDADCIFALPLSPWKIFIATNALIRPNRLDDLAMRANVSSVEQANSRIYARSLKPKAFIEKRLSILKRERSDRSAGS